MMKCCNFYNILGFRGDFGGFWVFFCDGIFRRQQGEIGRRQRGEGGDNKRRAREGILVNGAGEGFLRFFRGFFLL